MRSIVPHPTDPNTLYVAFSGGGVWKTTSATAAPYGWTPLTETLGSLSVGSLAMDIANPNTLYLGLGDPFDGTGLGVYKTTDGGASWAGPVYPGNATQIPQILVAPTNASIVLAATDAGLYRSTDGGVSFSKVPLATGQAGDPYVWSLAATGGNGMVLSLEAAPAATTGTTDGQDTGRDLEIMHVRRTDEHRVGTADFGGHLVAIAREAIQSADRNVVEREDLEGHVGYPENECFGVAQP